MKIVIIGAGNVGYHLGRKLYNVGEEVVEVFSRQRKKTVRLAKCLGAQATASLRDIRTDADLYILAVSDDAISAVAKILADRGCAENLIVHTSGVTPLTVFKNTGLRRYGIFYPLQSFSISTEPDFSTIPFCIDARQEDDRKLLMELAAKMSSHIYCFNDEQRALIHLAAVYANNFTNHLFHIAHQLLEKENIPFEILWPLINETVRKIKNAPPSEMQTGPAARGDVATINQHLQLLENKPEYRKIYQLLTEAICR